MKQIPESIIYSWMAWEVEAITKEKFFSMVDEYILQVKEPEIYVLELTTMDQIGRNLVREHFTKNIIDLDYEASTAYKYKLICLAFKQELLNVKQASIAIVKYLVDDEWGSLNSPNASLNELYDRWISGSSLCGDEVYYRELECILRHS